MTPKGIWMFKRRQRVISITGAGGKTSFMYAQALLNVRLGRRVVLTTTTHILRPRPQEGWRLLDAGKNSAEDFLLFGNTAAPPGNLLLCARQCGGQPQKLTSVFSDPREQDSAPSLSDAPFFRKICSRADIIISEADGARGLPLKLPGDFEPVLLQETKTVIGVAGLSCLGKPFGQVCYGDEATLRRFCADLETPVTEEMIAQILASPEGTRKGAEGRDYIAVLNQCDTQEDLLSAGRIRALLGERGVSNVLVCHLGEVIYERR